MFAVIDVGSNSVRLMLHDGYKTIDKEVKVTKLAEGLSNNSMLNAEAVERTARAVSFFVDKAKNLGYNDVYVFATAAVRQAKNGMDFCDRVYNLCSVYVDVISGEKEAILGLKGALSGADGSVLDIGGASTELISVKKGKVVFCKSINLGAVRLLDESCGDKQLAEKIAFQYLSELSTSDINEFCTGIGGTVLSLSAILLELDPYDRKLNHNNKITFDQISILKDRLFEMDVDKRRNLKGLQKERAEIIPYGAMILYVLMSILDLKYVVTSENDNLEGYLSLKRGLYE